MKKILALVGIAMLSGCAAIGSPEYGCSGLPEGVSCMPSRDVYEATQGGQVVRGQPEEEKNERDSDKPAKKHDKADKKETATITDPVIDTFVTPNLPDRPVPIRTPAQVMRIWVASWEDTDSGALIAPGYIYTEIEPRRWVIGRPDSATTQQGRLFKPLEQPSNPTSSK
ncbi:MAG: type IV conjugative transfer system lipoprotein TraV [Candidatus Thiodiazotropha endolucinida]|nr:type IV conjugative transfer system lipoprotein TraV [Candidatus Thiodiazotropha endolucinida]